VSQVAETGTQGATGTAPAPRRWSGLKIARLRDFALLPAIIVLFIVGALTDPAFATTDNLLNVLQAQTELAVLVLAETLILVAGKFDLSLEATLGLAPAIGVLAPKWLHISPVWSIPICLLTGVAVGAFNGLLVVKFRLSAFVLTLGMLITLHGLVIGFTKGASIFKLPVVAFRGFMNAFSPASSRRRFIRSNAFVSMKTSPRTSSRSGSRAPRRRSGIDRMVLRLVVMSSPRSPSPRVSPIANRPSS